MSFYMFMSTIKTKLLKTIRLRILTYHKSNQVPILQYISIYIYDYYKQ